MNLGRRSVWAGLDGYTAKEAAGFARRLEDWGYGTLWIPEGLGREPLSLAAWLLANTRTLTIATGITNIYGRDARTAKVAQMALNEQSGGRFLLGLGVSHKPLVEGFRGHSYGKPIAAMTGYLGAMAQVQYMAPAPAATPKTVIAALGPKMLEVARDKADGAHPYLVTPEHTAGARRILGAGKLLCPEQKVVLETDPAKAREIARKGIAIYLDLPNYRNNLVRLGFSDADLDKGGSDTLVDAIVAWGDASAINERIEAHLDAGADQVCIQALSDDGRADEKALAALAKG
ncbi:TIGR03620 family F420-dependent LLM class oxidoreductase [Emcibacter sp. SYSU 3D8]|uniref:TIGR03620 family F420-dependent LLM class oxidoreductase n=1 Tax=Emcibacter sp. SYSU 3D8 TaxID=3133969 RepID=UPI0031FEF49B